MRLPALLLAAGLLAPSVAAAQPQGEAGGPWAADADRDGRITRDEMRAYMERRFGLMDPATGWCRCRRCSACWAMSDRRRPRAKAAATGRAARAGGPADQVGAGRAVRAVLLPAAPLPVVRRPGIAPMPARRRPSRPAVRCPGRRMAMTMARLAATNFSPPHSPCSMIRIAMATAC